ncbi:hypothetical protein BaRGS_00019797 [Batillaria attramentaria]|uniref:RING-type domain-containing protein n=1 Tax=Batillaria attramentaria TaxID=370345 RepID=A0ABD0KP13_9CAEN
MFKPQTCRVFSVLPSFSKSPSLLPCQFRRVARQDGSCSRQTQQPPQQAHVYQTARPSTTDRQRSPAEGSQSQNPAQTPNSAAARNVAEIPAQQSGSSTAAAPAEVPSSQNASTSSETPRQVVTYAQLGIFTQQPKRQDMVVGATRCNTFSGWPHVETHTPEEMSDAGFYYTGHSDLVRCFYCKGGLKSWAEHLRPWVEHARFFPECPYVKQVKGHVYVEVVQDLHTKQERSRELLNLLYWPRTVAVGGAVGGASGAVGGATGQPEGGLTDAYLENADVAELDKRAEELENTIEEAKEERICKICRENEANILFLPCGHLVSCAHCAPALRTCAICRERVKGRVRVYTDDEDG